MPGPSGHHLNRKDDGAPGRGDHTHVAVTGEGEGCIDNGAGFMGYDRIDRGVGWGTIALIGVWDGVGSH